MFTPSLLAGALVGAVIGALVGYFLLQGIGDSPLTGLWAGAGVGIAVGAGLGAQRDRAGKG